MAGRAPSEEVASPEQRIGVEIDDRRLPMQRRGTLGYGRRRRFAHAIDQATHKRAAGGHERGEHEGESAHGATHRCHGRRRQA